jgi:dTDP-D-glucose 4,6-dehydratase
MEPRPQDPYGIGKLASEQLVRSVADVHGMEWVIAVPHNIVGPRQKYNDPYRNVASIFINMMLQGRQPYIYGDGNQMRCFSFIAGPTMRLNFSNTGLIGSYAIFAKSRPTRLLSSSAHAHVWREHP